jgi:protein-tyrosine phosphatase
LIDLHCHILPFVDDGPKTWSDFLEMARHAGKQGIKVIYTTPHHMNGYYINTKNDILKHVEQCNEQLKKANIHVQLYPGQEVQIHKELFAALEKDEILTLNNGKYLMLELPSSYVPSYTHEVVYELLLKEITPIIVHPERNQGFIENGQLLFDIVLEGALVQITSGSMIGLFGRKIRSFTEKIIDHRLAHFIATDAHNTRSRTFTLNEAYETITKLYGIQQMYYFRENAELLHNDNQVQVEQPIPMRKKILGLF